MVIFLEEGGKKEQKCKSCSMLLKKKKFWVHTGSEHLKINAYSSVHLHSPVLSCHPRLSSEFFHTSALLLWKLLLLITKRWDYSEAHQTIRTPSLCLPTSAQLCHCPPATYHPWLLLLLSYPESNRWIII